MTLARDELISLEQEQEQTDTLRKSLQKELNQSTDKAAKVQEVHKIITYFSLILRAETLQHNQYNILMVNIYIIDIYHFAC